MEAFKRRIRVRLWALAVVSALAVALLAVFLLGADEEGHVSDFIRGFQLGMVMGLLAVAVVIGSWQVRALRNPEKLRKLYIEENDERKRMIRQLSGSVGMDIVMYGLAAGSVIAGFFDVMVFFTLLGACLFVALTRGGFKVYYLKKM